MLLARDPDEASGFAMCRQLPVLPADIHCLEPVVLVPGKSDGPCTIR